MKRAAPIRTHLWDASGWNREDMLIIKGIRPLSRLANRKL
jgi:hypothetical protein